MKNEIKNIQKALQETKREQYKTSELLQLLWELMHEDYIYLIGRCNEQYKNSCG